MGTRSLPQRKKIITDILVVKKVKDYPFIFNAYTLIFINLLIKGKLLTNVG